MTPVKPAGFCPKCRAPLCAHGNAALNAPKEPPKETPPLIVHLEAWPLTGQAVVTVTEKGKPPRDLHVAAPVLSMLIQGALNARR